MGLRGLAPAVIAAGVGCPGVVRGASPAPSGAVSFMVFGDPAELAAYRTLVGVVRGGEPGHRRASSSRSPSQGDYRQRLGADLAAGTPADVVLINYRNQAAVLGEGSAGRR